MRRLDALQIPPCNLGVQFASSSFALILKIIVQFGYSKKKCILLIHTKLQSTVDYKEIQGSIEKIKVCKSWMYLPYLKDDVIK